MPAFVTRRMEPADRPAIEALLNQEIGSGFWDPSRDLDDIVVIAVEDGRLIGIASASLELDSLEPTAGPVGHVRIVAVDPSARRNGVATRLVSEVTAICEGRGARSLCAYAWVHGQGGIAPLSGALERTGYSLERRIEGFYAGAVVEPCPACGRSPCVCPADVYRRGVSGIKGSHTHRAEDAR